MDLRQDHGMIFEKFRLEGKTAIVTGGGRGLGKAMAVALSQVGADVVVTARTTEERDEHSSNVECYEDSFVHILA